MHSATCARTPPPATAKDTKRPSLDLFFRRPTAYRVLCRRDQGHDTSAFPEIEVVHVMMQKNLFVFETDRIEGNAVNEAIEYIGRRDVTWFRDWMHVWDELDWDDSHSLFELVHLHLVHARMDSLRDDLERFGPRIWEMVYAMVDLAMRQTVPQLDACSRVAMEAGQSDREALRDGVRDTAQEFLQERYPYAMMAVELGRMRGHEVPTPPSSFGLSDGNFFAIHRAAMALADTSAARTKVINN
jgi:hypothetical protein